MLRFKHELVRLPREFVLKSSEPFMPTLDSIAAILAHRRFTEFLGCKEDLWFEAKQNHEFALETSPRHRVELSKDVSALANAEGGLRTLFTVILCINLKIQFVYGKFNPTRANSISQRKHCNAD